MAEPVVANPEEDDGVVAELVDKVVGQVLADVVLGALAALSAFLIQQGAFLEGIRGDVEGLRTELKFMQSSLTDAYKKQGSDESIRTWISEIRNIAYDIEDIIETFTFKVKEEPIHASTWGRMSSSVTNCFCCICKNAKLGGLKKDIEKLKKKLLENKRQGETHVNNSIGITQSGGGGDIRKTTPHGDEDLDVVGFEDDVQYLQAKLFDDTQTRSVISILGMGGLGKTTLAKKLYNNNKIVFSLHAWIYVSREWKTEDLLIKLIKSFNGELANEERKKVDKMDLSELVPYLRNLLEERRYLVVIDDLWDRGAWESIKNVFIGNKKGSKIIITTRNEDVAELQDHTTLVHKLRFLGDEESWSLFCKKAFPVNNGVCPDDLDLETLGKEMTKKCGGLPLAISVLGGLLSSRKESREWETVKEHIWREIKQDSIKGISPILDLSYDDLQSDIKLCFLYLGIFPEDALIDVEQLVKLWVAEGFIPIDERRTPEEVSEGYLKELLRRNLVQKVERNWRMTSSCRVHNLVRDLALEKAGETDFLRVYDQKGSSLPTTCRKFAVHLRSDPEKLLKHSPEKVRTLHLLNNEDPIVCRESVSIIWSFRLLRVLELQRVKFRGKKMLRLFEGVGKMIHLRYLGLKDTNLDKLPKSIKNLKVLQTLYIEESGGVSLPKDTGELKELRHLAGDILVEDCPNLAGLSNLQTFKWNLVTRRETEEIDVDFNFLATLNNLRTLKMEASISIRPPISIEPLLKCQELVELQITGDIAIKEVPKDIHIYLTKLKYLQLVLSPDSEEDLISTLELLPNLLALHLSYPQKKKISSPITKNGFPRLKFLKLEITSNIELRVDEGGMPKLKFLCLENDDLKQTLFPKNERFWSLPGEEAMDWKFTSDRRF